MKAAHTHESETGTSPYDLFPPDSFTRRDDSDDAEFYSTDRFVAHIDPTALSTVQSIIGQIIVEKAPAILDLMASWDSHIPDSVKPSRVTGLGLNENELQRNERLTERVVHDLNKDPKLPFPDNTFDVVLNTVSIDYLTKPFEVFNEIGRVLKPNGLMLVTFSNRMFPQKVTRIWAQSSEQERVILVDDFFRVAGVFRPRKILISKGKPRPAGDKYAHLGIPSDPIYAVFAEKRGPLEGRHARPAIHIPGEEAVDKQVFEERLKNVKQTLKCPWCDERMKKWVVPNNPFSDWDSEYLYICFNDRCPYVLRGWKTMARQGVIGLSYRQVYEPVRDTFITIPIPNLDAMKESIVEEDAEE